MNQSAFTFGALAFAFLVFVTMKGDLAKWLGVFGLATPTQAAPAASNVMQTNNLGGLSLNLPSLPSLGNDQSNFGGMSLNLPTTSQMN